MANLIIKPDTTVVERLHQMTRDASYDISDGEPQACGIALHEAVKDIKAPKVPPKVPKIFVCNHCVFDCSYCGMRSSNGHTDFNVHQPKQLAQDALVAAKTNTHGVFISSTIIRNSDYTEELIIDTLKKMRFEHHYQGYIHAKIMPGTDPKLIEEAGWLADRLSVNIELPKSEGYATIAKQKSKKNILTPMGDISDLIRSHQGEVGKYGRRFAKSGQTTQMMTGIMHENDRVGLVLAEAMYKRYRLRRVYYSPFGATTKQVNEVLPQTSTPKWRTARMYQADRLLELYDFKADELLPETLPDLEYDIDPKASWALRHLEQFPVEVNRADYDQLIRVPGIGVTSAQKIIEARKYCLLTHDILLNMRISLKRAKYFITCQGKYIGGDLFGSPALRDNLCDKSNQISLLSEEYNGGGDCC